MRTTLVDSSVYEPLEEALTTSFFPKVFGWSPATPEERLLCALPDPLGLGIPIPHELARELVTTSENDGEVLRPRPPLPDALECAPARPPKAGLLAEEDYDREQS